MKRRPLLLETMVSRRMTRQGEIYTYRRPAGPPPNEAVDRWLHKTAQVFDFTPLFNGDQQQARWVAQDYIKHLRDQANRDGMDWDEVKERLRQAGPHVRRALNTFFVYYDSQVKR